VTENYSRKKATESASKFHWLPVVLRKFTLRSVPSLKFNKACGFCPLLKSVRLSVGTKLTLYIHWLGLYWRMLALHGNSRRMATFWNCNVSAELVIYPRRTPTRDLHMAFKISYSYDFVTKICRRQVTVILNHENVKIKMCKNSSLVAVRHTNDHFFRLWLYPWAM
jgi:hypothetical protein